jgi:crotonobetainyl-CoA:carnitine CoA-transferase CaiB-like acyl-CoA transferase
MTGHRTATTAPLAGVHVVDLSVFLPGPFSTQVLADLGAEVTKVEPPGGDPGRRLGGDLFASVNRGKRSIELDLKDAGDRRVGLELLATADIVVVGFRPGVVERLGVGYEAVRAVNPDIIYCEVSGYGGSGPDRERPGHDVTYLASSGALSIPGRWGATDPVRPGVPVSDLAAASYATVSVLAALYRRDRTGQPAHLDVSLTDATMAFTAPRLLPGRTHDGGRARHLLPTNDIFPTRDGRHVAVGVVEEHFWQRLRDVVATVEPAITDARFQDEAGRLEHGDDLVAILERAFRARDAAWWVEELSRHDIPVELVRNVDEAAQAATARGRCTAQGIAVPVLIDGETHCAVAAPPALDGDRRDVLRALARVEADAKAANDV